MSPVLADCVAKLFCAFERARVGSGARRQIGALPTLAACPLRSKSGQANACLDLSALCRGFNRSTQHLLILLDWEVSDGRECTDVVHAETAGRALGAMEERSMCGGHRPSA